MEPPSAATLAAAAESMSYSEIEERFYRTIDITPSAELDLTEELVQAQMHGRSRLVMWATIKQQLPPQKQQQHPQQSGDWLYCHSEQELHDYRERYRAYMIRETVPLHQEELSLALLDNEKGYTQAAALMEFLDRSFQAYYVIRNAVTVDLRLRPGQGTWQDAVAAWFGGPIEQEQIEYVLIVDFTLTRKRRRAPALQVASSRLFGTAVSTDVSAAVPASTDVGTGTGKVQLMIDTSKNTAGGNSINNSNNNKGRESPPSATRTTASASSSGEGPDRERRLVQVPTRILSMSSSGSRRLPGTPPSEPLKAVEESADEPPPTPPSAVSKLSPPAATNTAATKAGHSSSTTTSSNEAGKNTTSQSRDSGDTDSSSSDKDSSDSNSGDVPLSVVGNSPSASASASVSEGDAVTPVPASSTKQHQRTRSANDSPMATQKRSRALSTSGSGREFVSINLRRRDSGSLSHSHSHSHSMGRK